MKKISGKILERSLNFLLEIKEEAVLQGFSGLLVMIDEAGKTLEYALQDKNEGMYIYSRK